MVRNHGTKEVYNLHFATEITKADCLELEANLAVLKLQSLYLTQIGQQKNHLYTLQTVTWFNLDPELLIVNITKSSG